MTLKNLIQFTTIIIFVANSSRLLEAQTSSQSAEFAITALQVLQGRGQEVLVVQGELDPIIRPGGGGACASAAAIDAIQTLRLMAGLQPLANPHKAVLGAISKQDDLLNGRVTDEQLKALLTGYSKKHLEGWNLIVDVSPNPSSTYSPTAKPWSREAGPDMAIQDKELKIVTFTVTNESGEHLGRHFVLLKSASSDELSVLDPKEPLRNSIFSITSRKIENWGRRYFLTPPPKVKNTKTLEIDSVFRLTIEKNITPSNSSQNPTELKQKIDSTAKQLQSSNELLSPRKWREVSAVYGLPGLDLPTEHGGSGWSAKNTLEAFISAGRHDLNCRDVVGGAHSRLLLRSSNPKVQEIVRQVAKGNAYIAVTMTEPNVGSDFHKIQSTARKVEGGYLLSGEKRFVARLEQASHVIIFTQPASGVRRGLTAFVLPIDTPGLEKYSFEAHGLKGNSFGGMKFKDLRVDDWQMIGVDGEGADIFVEHFRYWRLMQVGAALGTAERALEMMVDRLNDREAFGGKIGRFSHLQQPLGQHTTELKMAKALAREAAEMLDHGEGKKADAIINGLKAEGVEIALAAVDSVVRAYGAEGYSDRVDLGQRLQDLNGLRIADGTTDVMRMSVVRQSYGEKGEQLWDLSVKGINHTSGSQEK